MTAKSYLSFEKASEPYLKNDKYYIDVINPKTKAKRSVRWYTEQEYEKQYGKIGEDLRNELIACGDIVEYDQRHVLGFDKGYVTVFKGNNEEWLEQSIARYNVGLGWYIISTDEVPTDVPDNLTAVRVYWDDVKKTEKQMREPEYVRKVVAKL